jgi:hypothetical protein
MSFLRPAVVGLAGAQFGERSLITAPNHLRMDPFAAAALANLSGLSHRDGRT